MLHGQLPTDDPLHKKGCIIVSVCGNCGADFESSDHLFLHCPFAVMMWNWLGDVVNRRIDNSSITGILSFYNVGWSPQLRDVILAAIIFIFWGIWHVRNQRRFQSIFSFWFIKLSHWWFKKPVYLVMPLNPL